MPDYSIYLCEYGHIDDYPVGGVIYGAHNEGTLVLPYCYAVIEGEGRLAVVDTGLDWDDYGGVLARNFGVTGWQPPATVLGRLGLDPADVDTAILSHNHFDHAGGIEYFPHARVVLQARELSHYQWVQGLPDRLQWLSTACDPDLTLHLAQRAKQGLLTLVEGEQEVLPGVRVLPAHDTHTAGSQYVTIDNDHDGRWVMAGDNVYQYENLLGERSQGRMVPIGLAFGSKEKCILCMDEMYRAAGEDYRRVVPLHEKLSWDEFPTQVYDDGLHTAAVSVAPGATTRITPS